MIQSPKRNAFLAVAAFGALALVLPTQTGGAAPRYDTTHVSTPDGGTEGTPAMYQNPVSPPAAENFGSSGVIRGRDGFWYAYGAGLPMNPGDDRRPLLPILRSFDLATWEYIGDVFTEETRPTWWGPRSRYQAPTIEYWDGRYFVIYTLKNAPGYSLPNKALGLATAPSPAGPWTDLGRPLVEPEYGELLPGEGERFLAVMDADVMTARDGTHYLYYGGYGGGIKVVELAQDGLRTVGEPVKIGNEFAWEGPQAVYREGWYYLFNSSGHCCTGPVSGYSVWVARSRSPLGPFKDSNGVPILGPRPGGTPVLAPNGNAWVGTGHHAMTTDLAGQDWFTFNGIERDNPYLDEALRGARRPMLIDRLDWVDGWPTVRGGTGASEEPVHAPATDAILADAFGQAEPLGSAWRQSDEWQVLTEPAGGFAHTGDHDGERLLAARRVLHGDVRVRGSVRLPGGTGVRGSVGFLLADRGRAAGIRVAIDRAEEALVLQARRGRSVQTVSSPLPASFRYDQWHELAVQIRGRALTAEVTPAGQDQLASAALTLPSGLGAGRFGVLAGDAAADVDDVTVTSLYSPHTELVPGPHVGTLDPDFSDGFIDGLDPEWSWVRAPAAEVRGGVLEFPVQDGDLAGSANDASVLLRDAPDGTWTVETKVETSWGDEEPDRHPQAGLVAYVNDDQYVRLSVLARGATEKTAFSKEMPYADGVASSDSNIPPTAGPAGDEATWLRLHHETDPVTGAHEFRAGSSRDGELWTWGGVFTLPANASVRLGLTSVGDDDPYLASFDYLRLYRGGDTRGTT